MLTAHKAKKIENIVLKLKNAISQIDIVNWLGNFKEDEWDTALEVLVHVEYFDADSISSHYEDKLIEIIAEIGDQQAKIENQFKDYRPKSIEEKYKKKHLKKKLKIGFNKPIIHSVGKYGKSGTAMMYYATHIPSYKQLKIDVVKSISNLNVKNSHYPTHIIHIDD